MSWNDFYRRRDALDTVLRNAERDPDQPLPCIEGFLGEKDLLLALHHRWMLKLSGQLGLALVDAQRDPMIDRVDAVSTAWRRAATENRILRAVLNKHADDHADALRPALDGERRLLALASGLAEPHEPADQITRVGATLLALLRNGPTRQTTEQPKVRQLWRGLPATA
jgi:hypothetical protein